MHNLANSSCVVFLQQNSETLLEKSRNYITKCDCGLKYSAVCLQSIKWLWPIATLFPTHDQELLSIPKSSVHTMEPATCLLSLAYRLEAEGNSFYLFSFLWSRSLLCKALQVNSGTQNNQAIIFLVIKNSPTNNKSNQYDTVVKLYYSAVILL